MSKRDVVLDCTRYNPVSGEPEENIISLEFSGYKVEELNNFKEGDMVTVSFVIQGRRYTDRTGVEKIFTAIRPYKIEAYRTQQVAPQQAPEKPQPKQDLFKPAVPNAQVYRPEDAARGKTDDLPF